MYKSFKYISINRFARLDCGWTSYKIDELLVGRLVLELNMHTIVCANGYQLSVLHVAQG